MGKMSVRNLKRDCVTEWIEESLDSDSYSVEMSEGGVVLLGHVIFGDLFSGRGKDKVKVEARRLLILMSDGGLVGGSPGVFKCNGKRSAGMRGKQFSGGVLRLF